MDFEQAAKHILREFVSLPREQFERFLQSMAPCPSRPIRLLTDKGIAFYSEETGRVSSEPGAQIDSQREQGARIIGAFLDRIEPGMFFASANIPLSYFFLLNRRPCWITILETEDPFPLRMPACQELTADETLFIGSHSSALCKKIPPLKCRTVVVLLKPQLEFLKKEEII